MMNLGNIYWSKKYVKEHQANFFLKKWRNAIVWGKMVECNIISSSFNLSSVWTKTISPERLTKCDRTGRIGAGSVGKSSRWQICQQRLCRCNSSWRSGGHHRRTSLAQSCITKSRHFFQRRLIAILLNFLYTPANVWATWFYFLCPVANKNLYTEMQISENCFQMEFFLQSEFCYLNLLSYAVRKGAQLIRIKTKTYAEHYCFVAVWQNMSNMIKHLITKMLVIVTN